jgi:hypothetical protein
MKNNFFFFILLLTHFANCQIVDSTKKESIQQLNKLGSTRISKNLRVGFGINNYFQSEIGVSKTKFTTSCTGFFAKTYYSSLEYIPKTKNYNAALGLKIGLEYNLSILAIGLETKYQTDFDNKDFVITPKIGLGIGIINVFYGYNISAINKLPNTDKHIFSIVANIPINSLKNNFN